MMELFQRKGRARVRKVNSGAEHKSLRPPSGRGRALLMKDFQSLYSVQPFTQIIPLKDIDKK